MAEKKKIVFINSPIRGNTTWKKLCHALEEDLKIKDGFDFLFLDIDSLEPDNFSPASSALYSSLLPILIEENNLTIICHGITSILIIETMLLLIEKDRWDDLRKIDQIIFLAPTIFRDKTDFGKRRIFKALSTLSINKGILNYKELSLVHSYRYKIPQLVEKFYRKIILADNFSNNQAMIPTSVLLDIKDQVLHKNSIEEIFDNIIKVKGKFNDFLYLSEKGFLRELKDIVLNPKSHKNIFKIRKCNINIDVWPLEKTKLSIGDEEIILDHLGEIRIKILFDPDNISKRKFLYRFSVLRNGHIEEYQNVRDYKNETDSSNIGRFHRDGNEFILEFVPVNSRFYPLALKIWNGFDDSQDWDRSLETSEIHQPDCKRQYFQFPVGDGNKNFGVITFDLSLNRYIEEGFQIIDPRLYHIPYPLSLEITDSKEIENVVIKEHSFENPLIQNSGDFQWSISEIRRGTILLTWLLKK